MTAGKEWTHTPKEPPSVTEFWTRVIATTIAGGFSAAVLTATACAVWPHVRARLHRPGTNPEPQPAARPARAADEVLAPPPTIGDATLRDWLIHHHHNDQVWRAVVEDFYRSAAAEPRIAAHFDDIDLHALQKHFLGALVTLSHVGLTRRTADRLGKTHAHLRITPADFDTVTATLVHTLRRYAVPDTVLTQLTPAVTALRERLVTVAA